MKLLADMNVSRRVVEKLREEGLDVARVSEVMSVRATDAEILIEAERRGAIILSHDQDFSTLLASSGARSPSLVNLRVSDVDVQRLTQLILGVLQSAGDELASGAVVTVDDARVRIRRLPIG